MDKIKQYYLLCTVYNGGKSHLIEELTPARLEVTFTKKEVQIYFKQLAGKYIIRESVIGGRPAAIDNTRPKILIY